MVIGVQTSFSFGALGPFYPNNKEILYLGRFLTNNKMILFLVVRRRKWLQALVFIKVFILMVRRNPDPQNEKSALSKRVINHFN